MWLKIWPLATLRTDRFGEKQMRRMPQLSSLIHKEINGAKTTNQGHTFARKFRRVYFTTLAAEQRKRQNLIICKNYFFILDKKKLNTDFKKG